MYTQYRNNSRQAADMKALGRETNGINTSTEFRGGQGGVRESDGSFCATFFSTHRGFTRACVGCVTSVCKRQLTRAIKQPRDRPPNHSMYHMIKNAFRY